jgi:DNA polymerase III subunit gamma/tau
MKRSRQESSSSEASGFLFATNPTEIEPEDEVQENLFGELENQEDNAKKTAKKSRKTDSKTPAPSLDNVPPSEAVASTASQDTANNLIDSAPIVSEQESLSLPNSDSGIAEIAEEAPDSHNEPTVKDEKDAENNTALLDSGSDNLSSEAAATSVSSSDSSSSDQDSTTKANLQSHFKVQTATSLNKREETKPSTYQVVARRYRPQSFNELIGQENVARALSNAIETDRVGHAYLFTGARGVGKTSCARIFAKALNCVEGPTASPCLKCDSCVDVATGDDVDVIEIDGASNRGVDEIRQLRQNATIAPTRSLYKIYIIDEVHMLTREAFNALLKTLEEPPARVKFIFCTTEPNKIPITILSRCQRFDFGGINGASIAERLSQIAQQEGAQVEEGVFEILARRANGSMRDAQSLLEQLLSFAPKNISQSDVHSMLGSVDDTKIFDLLDATVQGNATRAFELLNESANQGVDFGALIEQIIGVYRDLMVVGCGCSAKELMYSPVARISELQEVAQKLGARRILASLQILDQSSQRMRFSSQSRIIAELAFARLCQLDSFQSIESLITQLKQGTFPNVQLSTPSSSSDVSNSVESKKK